MTTPPKRFASHFGACRLTLTLCALHEASKELLEDHNVVGLGMLDKLHHASVDGAEVAEFILTIDGTNLYYRNISMVLTINKFPPLLPALSASSPLSSNTVGVFYRAQWSCEAFFYIARWGRFVVRMR